MITSIPDLLKKGELINFYPTYYTSRKFMMSAELIGRLSQEFSQLADEVDMLTDLLSQGENDA